MAFGFLKKPFGFIGDVAKKAAPLLALTGVGAPVAAGIGLAGGALGRLNDDDGRGLKGTVADALKGGATGGLGALALGKIGGEGGLSLGKVGGSIIDLIKHDPATAAQILTGSLGIIAGAKSQGEATDILMNLLEQQQGRESSLDPVRARALESLTGGVQAVRPNLDHIFRTENAFGRIGG